MCGADFTGAGAKEQKSAVSTFEDKHGHYDDEVASKSLSTAAKPVDKKPTFKKTHGRRGS